MSKNLPKENGKKKAIRIGAAVMCIVMAIGVVAMAATLIISAIMNAVG